MKNYFKCNWNFILVFALFWILLVVIRVSYYEYCESLSQYTYGKGKHGYVILFAFIKMFAFLIILFVYDKIFSKETSNKKTKIIIISIIIPLVLIDSIKSSYISIQTNNIKKNICSKSNYDWDESISEYVLESTNLQIEEYNYLCEERNFLSSFPILPETSKEIDIICIENVLKGEIILIEFTCNSKELITFDNKWNITELDNTKNRYAITNKIFQNK